MQYINSSYPAFMAAGCLQIIVTSATYRVWKAAEQN